jgi:hypothetical protein
MELRAHTDKLLFVVRFGTQTKEIHELEANELQDLAAFLQNELEQVTAFTAWRGEEPDDDELCKIAEYYEEIETIEYTPCFGFF